MLTYKLKTDKDTEYLKLPYRDLYVSPDLVYISGVTDYSSDVIDGEQLYLTNSLNGSSEIDLVHTETVRRCGIIPYELTLPVVSKEFFYYTEGDEDNPITESSVTSSYVEYNSDVSFIKDSKIVIDNVLYDIDDDASSITINSFSYIEDGKADIDGTVIDVDLFDGTMFAGLSHDIIKSGYTGISENGHEFKIVDNPDIGKEHDKYVIKFSINREKKSTIPYDDIQFGGYRHYVTYDGVNYYGEQTTAYTFNINGNTITAASNYSDSSEYYDVPFDGSAIQYGDGYLDVHDELFISSTGGSFVVIATPDHQFGVNVGSIIEVTSNKPYIVDSYVYSGETGQKYIVFCGKRYNIDYRVASYAQHNEYSGNTYQIRDISDSAGTISLLGNTVELTIDWENSAATQDNKVFYGSGTDIHYGIDSSNTYSVFETSGVTIGDNTFSGYIQTNDNSDGTTEHPYVRVKAYMPMKLIVSQIIGTSMYLCYPLMDREYIDPNEVEYISREMCDMLVSNKESLTLRLMNSLAGDTEISAYNFFSKAINHWMPLEASKYNMLERYIHIYRMTNYYRVSFPLTFSPQNNLTREDVVVNKYIESIKKKTVNNIVDMEKDVYYPVKQASNDSFDDIHTLRFNLHFRTRNLDNWKVINDDREVSGATNSATSGYCNWFMTDYKFYNNSGYTNEDFYNRLQRSSDLLGYLGFTDSEVRNQASKIGKSFLRLSFYSTKDPQTQVLLSTSTIFLNEQYALKKYMTYRKYTGLDFVDTYLYEEGSGYLKDGVNCFSELVVDVPSEDSNSENTNTIEPIEYPGTEAFTRAYNRNDRRGNRGEETYDYSPSDGGDVQPQPTENKNFAPALIDQCRMSSRIEVDCKHLASESAEGYYLYMFKDYARRKIDTTIYLRIDFNHAGVGQTIPMIIPTSSDGNLLTLAKDADAMKEGYKLSEIYDHLYIPVHVKYDDKKKRYVYWLDSEYSKLNTDEPSVMEFNLFEVKYKNEVFGR